MLYSPLAHQAVVGMIVDGFTPLPSSADKDQSGVAFEESVGLPFFTYAINDVIARFIAVYHVRNHLDVILQVCINGDGYLATLFTALSPASRAFWCPTFPARFSPQA